MAVLARTDIDAVYIAAPPTTHARYAIAAMNSGKAVFCEKPLAVEDGEATATGVFSANGIPVRLTGNVAAGPNAKSVCRSCRACRR
jgi:hypothetical protein